jgi:hypothetical protein
MQRSKFINPRGRAVVFDAAPYIFEKISGIGEADAHMMTSDPAGVHGKSFGGVYTDDREITQTISIGGATRKKMYENKLALMAVLSPSLYESGVLGRFEYTNDFGTWWIPAAVKRGPQGTARVGNYLKSEQLVFYCPDPFFRGLVKERVTMGYQGGGLRWPVRFDAVRFGSRGYKASIWSRGNRPSAMEVEITGPSTRPEIVKVKTGEYIRLRESKQLYEGDVLRIDTTPGRPGVTIQRSGGEIEDAIGYIDLSSTLFMLDPGENLLEYISGDDSQTCTINVDTLPWFGGV